MTKVLHKQFVGITTLVALLYLAFFAYMLNNRLVIGTLAEQAPLLYKIKLLFILLTGVVSSFSSLDTTMLIATALLVGMNSALLVQAVTKLRSQKTVRLTVGGGTLLGIAGAGCASCGLSIFSVFGVAGSAGLFPFHGFELQILSVILLLFSFAYTFRLLQKEESCEIKRS